MFNPVWYEERRCWLYVFLFPMPYDREPECADLYKIGHSYNPVWRHDGPYGFEDTEIIAILPGTEEEELTIHDLLADDASPHVPRYRSGYTEHYYRTRQVEAKVAELVQRMMDWRHEEMRWQTDGGEGQGDA